MPTRIRQTLKVSFHHMVEADLRRLSNACERKQVYPEYADEKYGVAETKQQQVNSRNEKR